jgi:hypothetical protein
MSSMSSERARRLSWPVTEADYLAHVALLVPDEKRFTITTSIALAQKAFNVRRNPRVSLLFSDPTASGLDNPPAVLVQGDAKPTDEIETSVAGFEDELRGVYRLQPASHAYGNDPLTRYFKDWYFMRLVIHVTPRRILWWPEGDFWRKPFELETDSLRGAGLRAPALPGMRSTPPRKRPSRLPPNAAHRKWRQPRSTRAASVRTGWPTTPRASRPPAAVRLARRSRRRVPRPA